MSEATKRREATRAEWLAAADKLAAAVMEARSEARDGSARLADLRSDIATAIREWDDLAWHANPYFADPPAPLDPPPASE